MFWSFIVGGLFGLGSKYVTGPISEFVASKVSISEREMAIVTFGLVMLAASVVAAVFPGHVNAFWLILGGTVGVFGFQLFEFAKSKAGAAKLGAADVVEDTVEAVEDVTKTAADAAEDGLDKVADAVDEAKVVTKKAVKRATKS